MSSLYFSPKDTFPYFLFSEEVREHLVKIFFNEDEKELLMLLCIYDPNFISYDLKSRFLDENGDIDVKQLVSNNKTSSYENCNPLKYLPYEYVQKVGATEIIRLYKDITDKMYNLKNFIVEVIAAKGVFLINTLTPKQYWDLMSLYHCQHMSGIVNGSIYSDGTEILIAFLSDIYEKGTVEASIPHYTVNMKGERSFNNSLYWFPDGIVESYDRRNRIKLDAVNQYGNLLKELITIHPLEPDKLKEKEVKFQKTNINDTKNFLACLEKLGEVTLTEQGKQFVDYYRIHIK